MDAPSPAADGVVGRYLELGLRLGRLQEGIVDAYYGPAALARRVADEAAPSPAAVRVAAERLIADLDGGADADRLDPQRRRWLRAQTVGVATVAMNLAGEALGYEEEVRACYGVSPRRVAAEEVMAAQADLDASLGGTGPLSERLSAFRAAQVIPVDRLGGVIDVLADDFRSRTRDLFGLPDGESVTFELVNDRPWSGFNYYEGDLRSRVAINTDLPVLSGSIGHLVAHEAYPGHHTEHCRKEVGLVRRQGHLEETIFLIGTPQCLLAEGLADLGHEILLGPDRIERTGELLAAAGVRQDIEATAAVAGFAEMSLRVRGHLALMLHVDGVEPDGVVGLAERWMLVDRSRAAKVVEFLMDPNWRAYVYCYVEGLPLCRRFVGGDPARFERLLSEPLLPEDLRSVA